MRRPTVITRVDLSPAEDIVLRRLSGSARQVTHVVAEFFAGTSAGLRVCPSPATRDFGAFMASLDELRRLSIERVLVAHGPPILEGGSDAIAAAVDTVDRS
jgi:glyoxylase-like metal-dependent hydrolase (beta-lactamase superfamily II)